MPTARLSLAATVSVCAAVAAYVAHLVAQHSIDVVRARQLIPRWDLATHLGHGWFDYHLLVTGQPHRMLWDLWHQGYWPPGLSVFQLPFYLLLGGDISSGLWSSAAAFVIACSLGAMIVLRADRRTGVAGAGLFVALLISSPYLLAYASVTMTEMLGAAAQLFVLAAYQEWRQRPGSRSARIFAVSLTALFFVKYNYFLLLAVPLVFVEWLEATSRDTLRERLARIRAYGRRAVTSPVAVLLVSYALLLYVIVATGGFQLQILGGRISVRSVGSSGHVVLYAILLRIFYLHRRGRIDWRGPGATDPRVRPLLLWFVLPVTVWLAAPYPNHLRDFANLVINRPVGEPSLQTGVASYLGLLRAAYFHDDLVLTLVLGLFVLAVLRYREQSPLMRLLIVAVPLQLVGIVLHQTRVPRFLLLTVILLCLAAACEAGRLFHRLRQGPVAAAAASAAVLVFGVMAAREVVTQERFTSVVFEHFTDSPGLRNALHEIRGELGPGASLLIVGQNNDLSPAMFRWQLGPASGLPDFPYPLGGAGRLDPARATHVLRLVPLDAGRSPLDPPAYGPDRLQALMAEIERGALRLEREWPIAELGVLMRLYVTRGPRSPT